jgi:hypothetical protein
VTQCELTYLAGSYVKITGFFIAYIECTEKDNIKIDIRENRE